MPPHGPQGTRRPQEPAAPQHSVGGVHAASGDSSAIRSTTEPNSPEKKASGLIGNTTLTSPRGYRAITRSTAREMLPARTESRKGTPPALTSTGTSIISITLSLAFSDTFVTFTYSPHSWISDTRKDVEPKISIFAIKQESERSPRLSAGAQVDELPMGSGRFR